MTLHLPYVFIPGDDWEKIALSPEVSREAGQRVVALMRFFANQPRFTEYLLAGGIGWLDIPFGGTGVRLHYRTLARQGTRPLLYGLGLFHSSQARASAGGFVSLITTLDKSLPRADLLSSFPGGGVFEVPESAAGVTEPGQQSWRELEGRSETLAPADAYRRIAACSTDEGDWRTLWKVQYDMPKIIDQAATAFFSSKFPCKDLTRPEARKESPPSPDPLHMPTGKPVQPPSLTNRRQILLSILFLFTTALFLASTVVYRSLYVKADGERRTAQEERKIAQKQRANALSASQDYRTAKIEAETARYHADNKLNDVNRKFKEYVEHTTEQLNEAGDKERKLEEKIAALKKEIAENEGTIAELKPKADEYDLITNGNKDTPNGNPLPNTPAPTE